MEDSSDPGSRVILVDFEHTSPWLPYSFLIWELWDKREKYLYERIRTRANLEVNGKTFMLLTSCVCKGSGQEGYAAKST